MDRRDFLKSVSVAAGSAALYPTASLAAARPSSAKASAARPNVLWISLEDISDDLGCYGDTYAITPNIDRFSAQGTRYDAAFAHMGVCAPARSGIITGMYPTSIGTNHMRCKGVPQAPVRCFTEYLRAAGYYCSNHSKTDYQFDSPPTAWDGKGGSTWWRGRAEDQPFFCVVNLTATHESRIRSDASRKAAEQKLTPAERHDPAKAVLPPYYPDTPVVRRDWAQYYDNLTMTDKDVANILEQLEADGLADDTIVWFWGDHGRGLARGKRWIYDSGLKVPLMVRVPAKLRKHADPGKAGAFKPGSACDELVSFVDFAPTMLSLCNVPVPEYMLGQAFLGPQKAPLRRYIYGARDRVDEAYDMIRCVRDERYKYIRNFMPHLTRALDVDYMNKMPSMQEMRRLHAEGKLTGPQMQYFEQPKPVEELYDTTTDPHEVKNLAGQAKMAGILKRMRAELLRWMRETGDFGLMPECEFDALKRPGDKMAITTAPGFQPVKGTAQVRITCETPGASIAYHIAGGAPGPAGEKGQAQGGVVLLAADAEIHGSGPRKGPDGIFSWRDPKVWVSWEADLPTAGKIPVYVYQARSPVGSTAYTLTVGKSVLTGASQSTGDWTRFQYVKVGEVDIPTPGRYTVTIKPDPKQKAFQMNLGSVVLGGTAPVAAPPKAPAKGKGKGGDGAWNVYSVPLTLAPGQSIEAKACRLGYTDSATVRYQSGGEPIQPEPARPGVHWRETVDKSGLVDRCLDLTMRDAASDETLAACVQALRDSVGSVRYWAVLGIRHSTAPSARKNRSRHIDLFASMLKDPSPAARIAAAQALCDWGEEKRGLPVLVEALTQGELTSTRLLAATALGRIGEKARPAINAMRSTKGNYVGKVLKHALGRLER
jgi:N-sulfoglucosamine sulfohydrolase